MYYNEQLIKVDEITQIDDLKFVKYFVNNYINNFMMNDTLCPNKLVISNKEIVVGTSEHESTYNIPEYNLKNNSCVRDTRNCKRYDITINNYNNQGITKNIYIELGYINIANKTQRYLAVSDNANYSGAQSRLENNGAISIQYDNDTFFEINSKNMDYIFPNGGFISTKIYFNQYHVGSTFYSISNAEEDLKNHIGGTESDRPANESQDHGANSESGNKKMYICQEDGVKQAFQIMGYFLFVVKIAIPLLLIILGTIDFSKAVFTSDDKSSKEAISQFVKRIIIAVIIFIIPTVFNFLFSLVEGAEEVGNKFSGCTKCLFEPFNENSCDFQTIKEKVNK